MQLLDFEIELQELYQNLEKLREIGENSDIDVSGSITEISKKIEKVKSEIYSNLTSWQKVQIARHPERPYSLSYINSLTEGSFIEIHGDRSFGDDKAIIGGFGKIDELSVCFIGQQKGENTKLRQYRNFGMPHPEGYRKALRIAKLAEKFGVPIVTFVDTPGAYPGIGAEEIGQGEAIAKNMFEFFKIKVPIISIIIGEGASGGAIAIAVADKVYMLQYTWYSVISPESCSQILFRNWDYKKLSAQILKLTSEEMHSLKLVDGVIKEPVGGAHNNFKQMSSSIKNIILKDIKTLTKKSTNLLIDERIQKFTKMGIYKEK